MIRNWNAVIILFLLVGCSNQAVKETAREQAVIDGVAKETKELLDKQDATRAKAQDDRVAEAADAAVTKKEAEDTAAAGKISQLKQDIRDHPGKYLEFSGMKYSDKGVVPPERRLTRVSATNKSPYTLRISDVHITGLDADDVPIGTAPISLNGSVPPGRTVTFEGADVKSASLQSNAQSTHVDVTGVEIIDVGENADQ